MPSLPPLNALRAFEVAARTGSFVQAGAELGVTAAAVSQQVKTLETHLGKQLFLRQGNRIVMTDAGRTLYFRVERALTDIADVAAQVGAAQGRARLVLSILPSLGELWLMPRLRGLARDGGLEVRTDPDPVVLARDGIDLRITYAAALYPDHKIVPLFSDRIVPVCAPSYPLPDGIATLPEPAFLHTDWGPAYATQPSWPTWFAAAGLARMPDPAQGLRCGQTSIAVAAAREGLGVALAPERIVAAELASGRLIVPHPAALAILSDLVMISSHARQNRRALQALLAHLQEQPA